MMVKVSLWFYEVESAVRLVPENTVDPRDLPPHMTPYAIPVGVDYGGEEALRTVLLCMTHLLLNLSTSSLLPFRMT